MSITGDGSFYVNKYGKKPNNTNNHHDDVEAKIQPPKLTHNKQDKKSEFFNFDEYEDNQLSEDYKQGYKNALLDIQEVISDKLRNL